jgi:hypothetical protein
MFNTKKSFTMKKMLTLPFIFLLLLGCNKEMTEVNDPSLSGLRMTKNKDIFNEAARKRGEENFSAPFEIVDVKRTGEMLRITVGHGYACQGEFEVIWDGLVMESYPCQTQFFVKFNAKCTTEPAIMLMVMETLEIDLSKVTDYHVFKTCIIHVSNASSIQDVYTDEPVSN